MCGRLHAQTQGVRWWAALALWRPRSENSQARTPTQPAEPAEPAEFIAQTAAEPADNAAEPADNAAEPADNAAEPADNAAEPAVIFELDDSLSFTSDDDAEECGIVI